MSLNLGELFVTIGAKTSGLTSAEREVVNSFQSMQRAANIFTGALAGVGLGLSIGEIVKATAEAESAFAQLEAGLKSTRGVVGYTADELADMSGELQKVSTYADDAIQGAQAILLTFTKIGHETFPEATKAIMDMSTRMGGDLKSTAMQVGKALQDPIQGANALRRAGVMLSESQQQLIKNMVDVGNIAGAQKIILKELQTEFGGSAQAARDTLGGALAALKNAFNNLEEGSGGSVEGTRVSLEGLIATMESPTFKEFAGTITGLTVKSLQLLSEGALVAAQSYNILKLAFQETALVAEKFIDKAASAAKLQAAAMSNPNTFQGGMPPSFGQTWTGTPQTSDQATERVKAIDRAIQDVKQHEDDLKTCGAWDSQEKDINNTKKAIIDFEENWKKLHAEIEAAEKNGKKSGGGAGVRGLVDPEQINAQRKALDDAKKAQEALNKAIAEGEAQKALYTAGLDQQIAILKQEASGHKDVADQMRAQAEASKNLGAMATPWDVESATAQIRQIEDLNNKIAERNQLESQAQSIIASVQTEEEKRAQTVATLDKALGQGVITQQQYLDVLTRIHEEEKKAAQTQSAWGRYMQQLTEDTKDWSSVGVAAAQSFQSNMATALTQMETGAVKWKDAWKNVLRSVLTDFLQAMNEMMVKQAMVAAFGGAGGGGVGFGSLFAGMFGGGGGAAATSATYSGGATAYTGPAIAPRLAGGRSSASSRGETVIHIYNTIDPEETVRSLARSKSGSNHILNVVNSDIHSGGPTRKTIRVASGR